jgi:CPA1 family monovalent cation:H+ antiporter
VFLLPPRTPQVGFLQLAAFVIVVLSLLQGLGLSSLVRWMRLPLPNPEQDRMQIRILMGEAQVAALERLDREITEDDPREVVTSLQQAARFRMGIGTTDEQGVAAQPDTYARLRLAMLDAERRAVLDARREGRYEESTITAVLGDFDTIEAAMKRSYRRDLPKQAPRQPARLRRRS